MSKLAPFYTFTRGMLETTAKTLAQKPGGALAQTIRATSSLRDKNTVLPDYVQQSLSIPLGTAPNGDPRMLTSFGFMHEDPLSYASGGLRGAGLEALSRLTPAVKGPLEWFTGRSFFQAGPTGGRPLEDLDPMVGRLAANVFNLEKPAKLGALTETIASNSPFTRYIGMARTLTDPRKRIASDVPIPGPPALLNFATGVKITDVPQRTQETILREAATEKLKSTGVAKTFQKTYIKPEDLATLSPEEQRDALITQALLNLLGKRAQKRAKGQTLQPLATGLPGF